MQDFRRLAVWQKAHALTLEIYRATTTYPRDETFALTAQTRRAATSIAANIAEGCGRDGDAELARFLSISLGSASELQYHVLLARDLGYLDEGGHTELDQDIAEVKRMLAGFLGRLRTKSTKLIAES